MRSLRYNFGGAEGKSRQMRSGEWCQCALRHFKSSQELDLKESTVRGWVTAYQKKLESLRKEGTEVSVSVLSEKQRGRPMPLCFSDSTDMDAAWK